MTSSAPSPSFAVTCPACKQRLRFALPAGGPERMRIQCAPCGTVFGVRRPGAAPAAPADTRSAPTPRPPLVVGTPTVASSSLAGAIRSDGGRGADRVDVRRDADRIDVRRDADRIASGGAPVFMPGERIAERYRVVRFLAQGGMGEVYEVEDGVLGERVALKTVRLDVARDAVAVERFRREILLARKVTHPNVCRIFDVAHHRPDGQLPGQEVVFLTMELLLGETLAQRLRRTGPLPAEEGLPIAQQICQGLFAAHQAGIVHRDLKPGNVVLVGNRRGMRAVVTDFGLARLESGHEAAALTLTSAQGIVGTPAYLAPEQLEGGEITTAVDIYALGIVLYEMATGTVPFLSDSVLATAVRRLKEAPASPRIHAPGIDARWEAAILRCLAREPAARFATALDVVEALSGAATPVDLPAPVAPTVLLPGAAATAVRGGAAASPAAGAAARTSSAAAAVSASAAGTAGTTALADSSPAPPVAPPEADAPAGAAPEPRPRRTRPIVLLLGLLLVLAAVAYSRVTAWRAAQARLAAGLPGALVTPRRSVAVLGFKDLSGKPGTAWLSPALAEMLSTELGAGGALRVIAGEDVSRMKVELKIGEPESLARDTLAHIRTLLGSDTVVLGSYLALEGGAPGSGQLRLDLRLQDAATGETTATVAESGTEAGLFALVSRAGERLRRDLGASGGASGPAAARPALAASPEAARLYAEGINKLRLFDPAGARDLLAQAVAADPGNALAHSGLAAAWATLGHDGKARDEAKAAFELSASLPPEERLLTEGRYRETVGDWGKAIELYRSLWSLYPDNLDHGLRLAAAQTSAGRGQEALATARALRALPLPARDDLRIDLAEAAAAGSRADFALQNAAAARARAKGQAQGASLLVAQARLLECRALRNLGQADGALAACGAGQRLYAAAGDRAGVAEALTHTANILYDRGDLPGAQLHYEEALATWRDIGNRGAEAGELNNMAVVLKSQGDLARARQLYEEVLAISRETGSRSGEAYALNNIAGVLLRRGDLDGAARLFSDSLAIRRELGDASGEAYALDNLGVALRRRGDLAGARRRHEEALAIRRHIGQKLSEVASLNNLGSTFFDQGDLGAARQRFAEALAAGRAIGNQTSTASALFGLGEVLLREGKLAEARQRHEEALGLRTTLGEKGTAAESRLALATLGLEAGDAVRAGDGAEETAKEFARQGVGDHQALALSLSALAWRARGDGRRAREAIDRATALLAGNQDLRARLTVELRAARIRSAAGPGGLAGRPRGGKQADQAVLGALEEAKRAGLLELRLEAELALAESARDRADLRARAAALEQEARAKGYALIAGKCAALLAGRTGA